MKTPINLSHLLGIISGAVYIVFAIQSNRGTAMDVFAFLGGYGSLALIVFLYWLYLTHKDLQPSLKSVLVWAILFRVIGVFGSPIFEDDYFRYLLDGCMFFNNGSPYGVTPSSLFQSNTLSAACREALIWVNNPDIPTIYGPVLQYVFALAYIISPGNIDALQIILVLVDITLILLLSRFCSVRNLLLYAWNPLVIKEVAFTAHPDIIGISLLFAAFTARYHRQVTVASILVALACAAKVFAFLALPFFLLVKPIKQGLVIATTLILVYLPFVLQGHTDLLVLEKFANEWMFNATVFQLFSYLMPDYIARLFCLGLFMSWFGYYFYHYYRQQAHYTIPRLDWVYGIFLAVSPVANAWYILWLLPFACIRPSYWAWTTSLAVSLTYVTGLNLEKSNLGAYDIAVPAMIAQVTLIIVALCFDFSRNKNTAIGQS